MLCPRDQTPLIMHQGVGACLCSSCHGVWFSRAALAACVRQRGGSVTAPPAPVHARFSPTLRHLPCPICQPDRLVAHLHEGIEVDSCPRCHGVWLDHGEMERLLRLPRAPTGSAKSDASIKDTGATSTKEPGVGMAVIHGADFLGTVAEAGCAVVEFFGCLG